MSAERKIKFTATPSKSRLTAGKVCYQGQIAHNQVFGVTETRRRFAEYMHSITGQANLYLDGLGEFIETQVAQGYRLDFGPFAVGLKMRGGLPAANSPFDEKVNSIAVEMMPSSAIKSATDALNPVNVTMDERCTIHSTYQTTPVEAYDLISCDGERQLVVNGSCIWVHPSATDEGIWIENDLGIKLLTGSVTQSDSCRCDATFTEHIDPGLYWLTICSRRLGSSELLRASRRITAK